MNKYLLLGLNVVLLIAVAVLFYLHFSNSTQFEDAESADLLETDLSVAYINSDSLLSNYEFFNELAEQMETKRQKLEAEYQNRAQGLQREIEQFQRNVNNMTIGQGRAVEEDLMKKQQNLLQYQERLQQQLLREEAQVNEKLYEKVSEYLKTYGKENNLKLVLTYQKGSGVLYADDSLNITEQVISGLNSAYVNEKNQEVTPATDTTAAN
ncbi:MAG: OmpH family outer membrane protein [Cyclobacteriaceae bacterium]